MTAHAMKGDKEKCLEAGMDDYVSKPIRRQELTEVVARVAERFLKPEQEKTERTTKPSGEGDEQVDEIFDAESLMAEYDSDKDLLRRAVEIYARDARERLARLHEAIAAGNAQVVKEEAHALKGSVGTFYASTAYETAYKLENMGAAGDLREAEATLRTLQQQMQRLRHKLDELLA
jgi:two-component system, sensor histidine kinase and response regulator